jgi:hypothetical protein
MLKQASKMDNATKRDVALFSLPRYGDWRLHQSRTSKGLISQDEIL